VPFEFEKLGIDGVILVKPKVIGDNRGFFMESYKKSEFVKNGIDVEFVQDNHSKSKSQAKLIRCSKGKIYDVVVDLRKDSKTFAKWLRVELSDENNYMLFIPEGFAHGFVVLSENAELLYKTNAEFSPELDRGVLYCDKDINVDWNIDFEPILSEKDKIQPKLTEINKEELL